MIHFSKNKFHLMLGLWELFKAITTAYFFWLKYWHFLTTWNLLSLRHTITVCCAVVWQLGVPTLETDSTERIKREWEEDSIGIHTNEPLRVLNLPCCGQHEGSRLRHLFVVMFYSTSSLFYSFYAALAFQLSSWLRIPIASCLWNNYPKNMKRFMEAKDKISSS